MKTFGICHPLLPIIGDATIPGLWPGLEHMAFNLAEREGFRLVEILKAEIVKLPNLHMDGVEHVFLLGAPALRVLWRCEPIAAEQAS